MPRLKKVKDDKSLLELQKVILTDRQKVFFTNMRSRWYDIVCWFPEEEIKMYLDSLGSLAYAYCVHDKIEDLQWHLEHEGIIKKVHTHIVLCFDEQRPRATRFVKLFNTTEIRAIQTTSQLQGSFDYLTHESKKAILEGKVKYEKSKLVSSNISFFENLKVFACSTNTLDIIDNIISGVGYREMVARYGRDFVLHYDNYNFMARKIAEQEKLTLKNELVED